MEKGIPIYDFKPDDAIVRPLPDGCELEVYMGWARVWSDNAQVFNDDALADILVAPRRRDLTERLQKAVRLAFDAIHAGDTEQAKSQLLWAQAALDELCRIST